MGTWASVQNHRSNHNALQHGEARTKSSEPNEIINAAWKYDFNFYTVRHTSYWSTQILSLVFFAETLSSFSPCTKPAKTISSPLEIPPSIRRLSVRPSCPFKSGNRNTFVNRESFARPEWRHLGSRSLSEIPVPTLDESITVPMTKSKKKRSLFQ